jgi:hypothetical protein
MLRKIAECIISFTILLPLVIVLKIYNKYQDYKLEKALDRLNISATIKIYEKIRV